MRANCKTSPLAVLLASISIAASIYFCQTDLVDGAEISSWELGADMHTNRTEITGELLNDKIYIIGGANYRDKGAVNTVEIYDPHINRWALGPGLPYELDHAPSAVYNGKIYILGGFLKNKVATDKLLIFDPQTNDWAEGTPMPSPRGASVAEVVNGSIYVVSGIDSEHNPVDTNEAYNVENNTWTKLEPIPAIRHHAGSVVVDDKIYVIGGRILGNGKPSVINEALTNLDDVWEYDPVKNNWTQKDSMPIRRSGFAAESLHGKIYVFGGGAADGQLANVESYDRLSGSWTLEPDMTVERSGITAVSYNNRIYVFGGQHDNLQALSINEVFTPGDKQNREGQSADQSRDTLSSQVTTEIFTETNFNGSSAFIDGNIPLMGEPFQDSISSIIISEEGNQTRGYMVELCEHASFTGSCMILVPGEYDIQALQGLNDRISSIRYLSPQSLNSMNLDPGTIYDSN